MVGGQRGVFQGFEADRAAPGATILTEFDIPSAVGVGTDYARIYFFC